MNLGNGGPDSGTLPLSLPEIVVSLRREFFSLAGSDLDPSSVLQVGQMSGTGVIPAIRLLMRRATYVH